MPTFQSNNLDALLAQPYNHKLLARSGDYIRLRNYSSSSFGFPRGAVYESGPIFIGESSQLGYLDFHFIDSVYTHLGAQIRTSRRPESPGAWYPAAGAIPENGLDYATNNWQSSYDARLRIANDTDIYKTGGGSIRFDYWGAGNIFVDCEFTSYPQNYQFMLIVLRSTIDHLGLQLMLDLDGITDEERMTFVKYLSYDILIPTKDTWHIIVWDLERFKTHPIKNLGIQFQNASDPCSLYLDRVEVGNYWSDLVKTPVDDYYSSQGDFSSITKKDYLQFRFLLGSADRLNDPYSSPGVRQANITYDGIELALLEDVPDLLRHQKYFCNGELIFPKRDGPELTLDCLGGGPPL